MNKQAVKRMIKTAKKRSALDHAMAIAEKAGKPTTAGIVTGAGLGAILASIGALSRSGEDPNNTSVLTNPLLLGTLGAGAGYLAGNSFDKYKPKTENHHISLSALLGLTGGVGTLGTMLANEDAKSILETKKKDVETLAKRLGLDFTEGENPTKWRTPGGILNHTYNRKSVVDKTKPVIDKITKKPKLDRLGNPLYHRRLLTGEEIKEFQDARKGLAEAYIRAGDVESAIREAGLDAKEAPRGFINWLRNGRTSPLSWMKSLNPFKGPIGGKSGIKLIGSQLGNIIKRNPKASGLAALALLAGGGKAVYDYTKD